MAPPPSGIFGPEAPGPLATFPFPLHCPSPQSLGIPHFLGEFSSAQESRTLSSCHLVVFSPPHTNCLPLPSPTPSPHKINWGEGWGRVAPFKKP